MDKQLFNLQNGTKVEVWVARNAEDVAKMQRDVEEEENELMRERKTSLVQQD